jgi:hypothetical protein
VAAVLREWEQRKPVTVMPKLAGAEPDDPDAVEIVQSRKGQPASVPGTALVPA